MESPPVTLQWRNVTLDVKMKNPLTKQWQDKRILDNVHGIARPGELLALMGPSGAGKSSLLDCISGRNVHVTAESSVTVNGQPWSKQMKRFSSYIMQDDLFYQTITVREHLTFQARLRLGNKYSESECEARVKTVIEELGLTKCRDSLIGGPSLRGISGGERKRLSLATEMLTNPSILFVDEPTSGLDSFTAEAIVLQLQQLAHEGRTVIATIHQPSPEIFALFDKLYLLSDGAPVFHGNAQDVVPYFDALGYQCPSFMNPSDYFMRQLVVMDKSSDPEGVKRLQFLKDAWTEHHGEQERLPGDNGEGAFTNHPSSSDSTSQHFQDVRLGALRQIPVLAQRNLKRLVRDRIAFKAALFQTIFISLLVGLIYLQLSLTQKGIQNIAGVFFFISMNQTLITAKPLFVAVPIELPMIIREYKAGLFNLLSWYVSKNISEVVFQVFLPIVYFIPLYFLVGIGHGFRVYISMQVVVILINSAAAGFGYMVTSFCRRVDIAPIVGVALILPFLLFGGLFLNSADAPDYLVWIQYISPVKYGFEALMKIYWDQIPAIACDPTFENCIAATGQDVLKLYSMESRSALADALLMVVLNVAFRTIGFLALWFNLRSAN
ncbi:Atp-binding protein [Globisporangium polare]